jgi:methylthioribose-1-phosphate isomerase
MKVGEKYYESIWIEDTGQPVIKIIDQRKLPFFFETMELGSVDDVFDAITDMAVRGAPLIGAAGAFGIYLATLEINMQTNIREHLSNAARYLISCRPTAVNLSWAVSYVINKLEENLSVKSVSQRALAAAKEICEMEKENCRAIGRNGLELIKNISSRKKGEPVNILTHCNAGWLATIDYGTALAPVYLSHDGGIPVHVWVDETRPRNQGAKLTAWELGGHGVPYTLIADNAGGYLMQQNMVDIVIVGSDRTTRTGDVANKTGTYPKALAAHDNGIPFYVALPSTSVDFSITDGLKEIEIEKRDEEEVKRMEGYAEGKIHNVLICPENAKALNYGFDITPARLITGLITERGICGANEKDITEMFSEKIK